jgi:hypothetical protein
MGRAHARLPDGSQTKERRAEVLRSLDAIEPGLRLAIRDLSGAPTPRGAGSAGAPALAR